MNVTALEPEPRSGGVRVQLDGKPFATVGPEDVFALRLAPGRGLSEAGVADLTRRSEVFGARSVAKRMLAARALPSGEILRRLARKGHARWAADAAVESLRAAGLVDDVAYARHYVRTRALGRRYGPKRLRAELRRMGLGEREADSAVREVIAAEGVDADAVMREAALRKARSLVGVDPVRAKRRLRAFLVRRGFSSREIAAVVKEALAG